MRMAAWALAVAVVGWSSLAGAGCAAERLQRLAVGRPATAIEAGRQEMVRALVAQVDADRSAVLACFDAQAERTGSAARQEVTLHVWLGSDGGTLERVEPRTPRSATDGDLMECLRQRVQVWRIAGIGAATVPLAVHPKVSAARQRAEVSAWSAPTFKPEE